MLVGLLTGYHWLRSTMQSSSPSNVPTDFAGQDNGVWPPSDHPRLEEDERRERNRRRQEQDQERREREESVREEQEEKRREWEEQEMDIAMQKEQEKWDDYNALYYPDDDDDE